MKEYFMKEFLIPLHVSITDHYNSGNSAPTTPMAMHPSPPQNYIPQQSPQPIHGNISKPPTPQQQSK